MTVFASEYFTASDGTNLTAGGNWTRGGWVASGDILIANNRGYQSGGTQVDVYNHTAPSSADYSVSVDLHYLADATNAGGGVLGRVDTGSGTGTYYMARINRVNATSGNWQLYKRVSGTFTQLGSNASQTVAAGNSYNLKLDMSGSSISVYDEGGGSPTIGPITDTSITAAGRGGIRGNVNTLSTSGYHFDNWQAEEAGSSPTLVNDDATHTHTVDNITLTTATTLAVADCMHGHAANALALAAQSLLAVADMVHAHAADNITLGTTGADTLTVADANHAHATDALALTVQAALAVDEMAHAHAVDAVVLAVQSVLAVADATHGHTADAVVLGVAGATTLAVADATHAHAVDGLVLTTDSLLAIQDALHAHAAEALDLSGAPVLLIAEALHAHTSDGLALTVDAWLVVTDALHGHTADNVTLQDPSIVLVATWGFRVPASARSFRVPPTTRSFKVPS